jgi:predicted nucleotidyltransferase
VAKRTLISPEVARERAERAARFLGSDPRVKLVFFFGSAANPERTLPVGDVDLAILTDPPLTAEEILNLRNEVVLAAEEGIELFSLNEVGVFLRYKAVKGRCLYSESPELKTDYLCRTHSECWDFQAFLKISRRNWRFL